MLKLQRLSTRISYGTAKVIFGGVLSGIRRSLSKLASFPFPPSHAQQLRRVASLLSPNFLLFPYSIPVWLCAIYLIGFICYYLYPLLLINQLVVYFVEWLNVGDLVGFGIGWGRPSFGIAFDIDGVIVRGNTPIGGSPNALMRLYDDYGSLKVPFVFLTNGGGIPESRRAIEMSKLFGLNITESQVLEGYSPFKQLVKRFQNKFVVAVGKGEPAAVMTTYGFNGFRNVLAIDDYASCFDDIDPVSI